MKNRRDFIKKMAALTTGVGLTNGLLAKNISTENVQETETEIGKKTDITLTVVQTTDVHCQIHAHDELFWENNRMVFRKTGGYARIATMFSKLKKSNPHTFFVDTGDMFQGSELSVETLGEAYVPILNALNYNLYLPGNWEVIYGKKRMQTLMGSLNGPKVCANLFHDLGDNKKGELVFPPYYIWNVGNIKIGFLGYTDPWVPIRQSPAYSKGIVYTKPEENLAYYVDVLRNQEKCNSVIILAHLGLSQQIALANMPECEGVDFILGGDTHERVRIPIVCKYASVVEPGAFGSFAGKLNLTFREGKMIQTQYQLLEVDAKSIKVDTKMDKLVKDSESKYLSKINEIIGYSTLPLYRYFVVENTIDTLILNAVKWAFPEADVALSNGFRFCPPKSTPDATGNVPITQGYLFDMLPVDSMVRKGNATGGQIKAWLEKELNNVFAKEAGERLGGWVVKFNGMHVEFNAFEEKGKRVKKVEIGGEPLDINKTYLLTACEREGDPADMLCRLKGVTNPENTGKTLHQLVKAYLKQFSPVTPTPPLNAKILDAPQSLLTQVYGVDYSFR